MPKAVLTRSNMLTTSLIILTVFGCLCMLQWKTLFDHAVSYGKPHGPVIALLDYSRELAHI